MANGGVVLFTRGEESSDVDDIWDDSALIKAYDRAINIAKQNIRRSGRQTTPSESRSEASNSNSTKSQKYNRNRRKRRNEKGTPKKWCVGEYCRAVYSGDGKEYEAVVKTIDSIKKSCIVEFVAYKNTEELLQEELAPSHGKSARQAQTVQANAEMAQFQVREDVNNQNARKPRGHSGAKKYKHTTQPSPQPPVEDCSEDHLQQSNFTDQPPFKLPSWLPSFPPSGIPAMPIPPPPPVNLDDADGDSELLSTMLMAWYMSGYHTGYYQGLKNARSCRSTSSACSSGKANRYR